MVGVGLRKFGEETGLKVVDGSLCGKYQGFFIRMDDLAGFKRIEVKLSPLNEDQIIKLDGFISSNKGQYRISNYSMLAVGITFYISDTVGTMNVIKAFLPALVETLQSIDAEPLSVCGICGESIDGAVSFCLKGDATIIGHKACLEKPEEKPVEKQAEELSKSYGSGFFGAFLGMVVGIIPWILISLAGFIAGIGGFILALAVKFGYEKLGGKTGKPKVVAIIAFTILGVILATLITWTIAIYNHWQEIGEPATIFSSFVDVFYNMAYTPEILTAILSDFGIGLLFAALGSYRFIMQIYKDVKTETVQPVAYTIE